MRRIRFEGASIAAIVMAVALAVVGCGRGATDAPSVPVSVFPVSTPTSPAATPAGEQSPSADSTSVAPSMPAPSPSKTGPTLAPALPSSNLPTITIAQLPPEGRKTLVLIASNGPFPYRKDGVVFSNRERRLPKHDYGWYQEYTVITPGSPDRGARRIISGRNGERYFTADHYASFQEVIQGGAGS